MLEVEWLMMWICHYRVFVNGRGRDVIMEDMRRRIDRGDIEREKEETIQVCFLFIMFNIYIYIASMIFRI